MCVNYAAITRRPPTFHMTFQKNLVLDSEKYGIIRKILKGRKQTNMEGGQRSTYLRQTRALSGPRVSVAKT